MIAYKDKVKTIYIVYKSLRKTKTTKHFVSNWTLSMSN